jgi:hypothetical protein
MKSSIFSIAIYSITIVLTIFLSINIGAELITQYEISTQGLTTDERYLLANDMGFGLVLMFGLIPEIILGLLLGVFIGNKLNAKRKKHITRK